MSETTVCATDAASAARATALAAERSVPFLSGEPEPGAREATWCVLVSAAGLALRPPAACGPGGPLTIEFLRGTFGFRLRRGGGRGHAVARAVGLRGSAPPPSVYDATAGLGRDAFLLAWLGCAVDAVERDWRLHLLLTDALERARADPAVCERLDVGGLAFRQAEAREELEQWSAPRPDVVYLDPMHPERGGAALVKREMRILQELVGRDADAAALLAPARAIALRRVVVKRPLRAEPLGPGVHGSVKGKTTRFDVYRATE